MLSQCMWNCCSRSSLYCPQGPIRRYSGFSLKKILGRLFSPESPKIPSSEDIPPLNVPSNNSMKFEVEERQELAQVASKSRTLRARIEQLNQPCERDVLGVEEVRKIQRSVRSAMTRRQNAAAMKLQQPSKVHRMMTLNASIERKARVAKMLQSRGVVEPHENSVFVEIDIPSELPDTLSRAPKYELIHHPLSRRMIAYDKERRQVMNKYQQNVTAKLDEQYPESFGLPPPQVAARKEGIMEVEVKPDIERLKKEVPQIGDKKHPMPLYAQDRTCTPGFTDDVTGAPEMPFNELKHGHLIKKLEYVKVLDYLADDFITTPAQLDVAVDRILQEEPTTFLMTPEEMLKKHFEMKLLHQVAKRQVSETTLNLGNPLVKKKIERLDQGQLERDPLETDRKGHLDSEPFHI